MRFGCILTRHERNSQQEVFSVRRQGAPPKFQVGPDCCFRMFQGQFVQMFLDISSVRCPSTGQILAVNYVPINRLRHKG